MTLLDTLAPPATGAAEPGLSLLCLPYSGASASVYGRWRRTLPSWIRVQPVELPGRGRRLDEPLQTDMGALVRQLANELQVQAPYVLLGHSLGALLAFELAHALRAVGHVEPQALVVCGSAAPTRREDYSGPSWREPRGDARLMDDLRRLGGTPEAVLADAELMRMALPVLRADFLLCGHYRYGHLHPLTCPIRAFAGADDRPSADQLEAWRRETTGPFERTYLPGGHFFIHTQESAFLDALAGYLRPLSARSGLTSAPC